MARELFVYWKVTRDLADAAFFAATGLVQAVRKAHPELQVRLMRRAEEAGATGDKATFMETYSALPAGVTPALQAAIEAQAQLAFGALGHPARHVEVFQSLSD